LIGAVTLWLGRAGPRQLVRPRQRLLLFWGALSLIAVAGFREWAQVVPSLALLAGIGIGRIWEAAGRADGLGLGHPLAGRIAVVALFGTIFALSSSFQLLELRRAQFERGPSAKPADPEQIATYLRREVPAGPIFVWADAGQIYALSGRQPATRFVIAEFTDTVGPRAQLSRAQVQEDLRAHPPAAIVVDPHGADEPSLALPAFTGLDAVIKSCYQKVSGMPASWSVYLLSGGGADCVARGT
jgi:hypothetical protein